LGLIGMRERVAALHGTLTIDSAPGRGTTISVDIPLRKPNDTSHPAG
jgi:signal transduction histidine kinase